MNRIEYNPEEVLVTIDTDDWVTVPQGPPDGWAERVMTETIKTSAIAVRRKKAVNFNGQSWTDFPEEQKLIMINSKHI